MTFYNKKEEVIDIQLTQYGKLALALGKFRPHYYAFSDDEIIYDISYAALGEHQNDIQDRILTEARKKPGHSIYGSETKIAETNALGQQSDGEQQLSPNQIDTELLLKTSLLHGAAMNGTTPSWQFAIAPPAAFDIAATISKTTGSYNTTSNTNVKCSVPVAYIETRFTFVGEEYSIFNLRGDHHGLVVSFKEDFPFCKEEEYEISLYEIEAPSSSEPRLVNLYFETSDPSHEKVSDRFEIRTDEFVPAAFVPERFAEECENIGLKFEPPPRDDRNIQIRDIYEKMNVELPDCEEGED